jgi:hypothetical protein
VMRARSFVCRCAGFCRPLMLGDAPNISRHMWCSRAGVPTGQADPGEKVTVSLAAARLDHAGLLRQGDV